MTIAVEPELAFCASLSSSDLQTGVLASIKPATSTINICIAKVSNAQNPWPQDVTACSNEKGVKVMLSDKTTSVNKSTIT